MTNTWLALEYPSKLTRAVLIDRVFKVNESRPSNLLSNGEDWENSTFVGKRNNPNVLDILVDWVQTDECDLESTGNEILGQIISPRSDGRVCKGVAIAKVSNHWCECKGHQVLIEFQNLDFGNLDRRKVLNILVATGGCCETVRVFNTQAFHIGVFAKSIKIQLEGVHGRVTGTQTQTWLGGYRGHHRQAKKGQQHARKRCTTSHGRALTTLQSHGSFEHSQCARESVSRNSPLAPANVKIWRFNSKRSYQICVAWTDFVKRHQILHKSKGERRSSTYISTSERFQFLFTNDAFAYSKISILASTNSPFMSPQKWRVHKSRYFLKACLAISRDSSFCLSKWPRQPYHSSAQALHSA